MTPSEGKCGIINIFKVFKFCFCASGSKASVSVFFFTTNLHYKTFDSDASVVSAILTF
jgi:hypothetical protein